MNPLSEQDLRERFKASRTSAPRDLAARIMQRLPARPNRLWRLPAVWPNLALAGAAAALVALLVVNWQRTRLPPAQQPAMVNVHFRLHAPGAQQVELVGSFNHWRPGTIRLDGPDASGHWTATVALPEGRHEYLFLVNGQQWVTDPAATVHRPDGFGHLNAVIEVAAEGLLL